MGRGAHARGISAREFARRFAAPAGGRPDGARSGLRNVCFDRTLTPLGSRRGNVAFLLARLPGAVRKDECFRNLTAFQAREAFPDVQPTARVRPPVRSGSDHWTPALGDVGAAWLLFPGLSGRSRLLLRSFGRYQPPFHSTLGGAKSKSDGSFHLALPLSTAPTPRHSRALRPIPRAWKPSCPRFQATL